MNVRIKYIIKTGLTEVFFFVWRLLNARSETTLFKNVGVNAEVNICMKTPLGIGDLIMMSPLLNEISYKFKEKKIILITPHKPFINLSRVKWKRSQKSDRGITRIVVSPTFVFAHMCELRGASWYMGYFFSKNYISNSSKINWKYDPSNDHYLHRTVPVLKDLKLSEFEHDVIYPRLLMEKAPKNIPEEYICVAPFVNWKARQYPYTYYYEILRWVVSNLKMNIVIIGGVKKIEIKQNKYLTEKISKHGTVLNLTGKTTLKQSINIIHNSKLYLGNDSGPSHIAFIEAKKSIVIFGSILPESRLPLNSDLKKNIITIDNRQACPYYPCYTGLDEPKCNNDYICLKSIAPKSIINHIQNELDA